MTRFKIILVGGVAIAGVTVSLVIEHQAEIRFRQNDATLLQQAHQLAELAVKYQRLSNNLAKPAPPTLDKRTNELAKLRSEAETLRKQYAELRKQITQNEISRAPQTNPAPDDHWEFHEQQRAQMASGKKKDAETLRWALSKYVFEHQGEFPSSFDQVAEYLRQVPASLTPLTGTNEFEIVYQGTSGELTNVPQGVVALIRERKAWLAPSGKMAKVYGMLDHTIRIVESDDNFQSWEAQHVIPPPVTGR